MIAAIPERRVLFVDDDVNVLRGVRRMMHGVRDHVHVLCAEGGEQALDLMEKAPIDLIVADMLNTLDETGLKLPDDMKIR